MSPLEFSQVPRCYGLCRSGNWGNAEQATVGTVLIAFSVVPAGLLTAVPLWLAEKDSSAAVADARLRRAYSRYGTSGRRSVRLPALGEAAAVLPLADPGMRPGGLAASTTAFLSCGL